MQEILIVNALRGGYASEPKVLQARKISCKFVAGLPYRLSIKEGLSGFGTDICGPQNLRDLSIRMHVTKSGWM